MNLKIPFLMASAAACLACAAETVVVSKVSGVSPANRTAEFQKEIDGLSAAGGGTLHIPAGEYVVASLRLKDGVTLHLDKNAYLFGSSNECEYVRYKNDGDTAYSVIYADGAKDVAVEGDGVIDGRGALHNRKAKGGRSGPWDDALSFQYSGLRPGWDDLYFHDCRNVRVEGVTLRNASS